MSICSLCPFLLNVVMKKDEAEQANMLMSPPAHPPPRPPPRAGASRHQLLHLTACTPPDMFALTSIPVTVQLTSQCECQHGAEQQLCGGLVKSAHPSPSTAAPYTVLYVYFAQGGVTPLVWHYAIEKKGSHSGITKCLCVSTVLCWWSP